MEIMVNTQFYYIIDLPLSLWIVTVTVLESDGITHPNAGEQLVKLIINVSLFSKRVSSVILKMILGGGDV